MIICLLKHILHYFFNSFYIFIHLLFYLLFYLFIYLFICCYVVRLQPALTDQSLNPVDRAALLSDTYALAKVLTVLLLYCNV